MDKFVVSSSPHITGKQSTQSVMRDVIIALIPSVIAGVVIFGIKSLIHVLISVISAVLFEGLWNFALKKENSLYDLSACVTGILVGLIIPVYAPLWITVPGCLFAIIIVKQLFGGLGQNFINPALAGRAFMLASWPVAMTAFGAPDAVSSATPLALAKSGEALNLGYPELFFGNISGCIGETSVIAILIGAAYLVLRRVITLHAPLSYIISTAVFGYIMGYNGAFTGDPLFSVLSGGILFGSFFMLTDYVTTPTTKAGQIIAGVVAGFLTVLIRVKGGYPEGVTYAILLVNVITPLIDKFVSPRRYGRVAKNG